MDRNDHDQINQIKEFAEMRVDIKYIKQAIDAMISVKEDVESLKKWRTQITSVFKFIIWLVGFLAIAVPVIGYVALHLKFS